jgi:hypothetical protein
VIGRGRRGLAGKAFRRALGGDACRVESLDESRRLSTRRLYDARCGLRRQRIALRGELQKRG